MSSENFLQRVLAGFAQSLQPLQAAVASPQAFAPFLGQFGWTLAPADLTHVTSSLGDLSSLAADPSSLSLEQLTTDLVSAANVIRRISSSGAPAAFASTFPRELLDCLVYYALAQQCGPVFSLLHFAGVLSERRVPSAPDTGRGEYIERQIHWDRLGPLADQPLATFEQSYGWGTNFDADAFLRSLGILLRGFGGHAGLYLADRNLIDQYYSRDTSGAAGTSNLIISAPLVEGSVTSGTAAVNTKLAFLVIPIPPTATVAAPPDGLALMPVITGQASDSFAISDTASLKLAGDFITRPVRAEIHPTQAVLRGSAGDTKIDASVRVDGNTPAGSPWILFGDSDSSHLEASVAHASLGLTGQLDGDLDLQVEVGLDTAALVIDYGESDGFVKNTVSSQPSRSPLSLVLKWSRKSGFSVGGQPKLQIAVPVQQSIGGVITIQSIGFSLGAGPSSEVELDAMVTLSASIGPIQVTISDVGLRILLSVPADTAPPGNLGNVDLGFGFKPPSGAGLAVDAVGVSGGGFLRQDETKQEYSGMLQLQFTDLALQAFALITTQVAGAEGYSLLAMIDADFPPVQLGWGFTLDGVGGLMAVHRSASVDALRAALKADKLSTIMFPKSAITNAPQILAQLDTFFPTAPGRFLFGPMALIGWGTPPVLIAALAIIIELPEPIRIILLARLAVRLPSESDSLVRINMDALGVLDLGQNSLSLDATLFDSRLLKFALSGDMALRASWAGEPREFLLSVGGFHPRFTPPTGFPTLKRLSIDMSSGSIATLHLESYLAITSNTLQIGANLHVVVDVSAFSIDGHLGFDALFQRDPFHFDGDISGSVTVSIDGEDLLSVSLDATLTGPAPWQIAGKFKVHIIFVDVHKSFSRTWGDDAPADQIAAVDVGALLATEFGDPRSWGAQLADGTPALVTSRDVQNAAVVVAHPLARLEVHERTAPLGLDITRLGGAPMSGANHFAITDFRIGGTAVPRENVQDDFAPAEFLDMSDDEKLAQPSFERHDAGVRSSGGLVSSGSPVNKEITYETFFIDETGGEPRTDPGTPVQKWLLTDLQAVLSSGSAARATMMRAGNRRYTAPGNPIRVAEPAFVLVDADTLAPVGIGPAKGAVYSDVRALLNQELSRVPTQQGHLQIVATHEMVAPNA